MITQRRLKSLLHYCPDTGEFTWLVDRGLAKKGHTAGSECPKKTKSYILIGIDGRLYRAHRLAWFYMTGKHPMVIDHINGDGTDNRWCNLRSVSQQDNCRNMRKHSHNTSGVCGVSWRHQRGKWRAYIMVNNKQVGLGHYESFDEAVLVRKNAESFYGFHVNHGTEREL